MNASDSANRFTSPIMEYIKVTQAEAEEVVSILASIATDELYNTIENDGVIASILGASQHDNLDIVSGGIWFEPYTIKKELKDFLLFYNREDNNQLKLVDQYLDKSNENYRDMPFYKLAKNLSYNLVAWTDVYIDPVTHVEMITAVSPIYKGNQFIGVASLDIKIGRKDKIFWQNLDSHDIYIMMVDKSGNIISKSPILDKYISTKNIHTIQDKKVQKVINKIKPLLTHAIKYTPTAKDQVLKEIYLIKDDPILKQESVIAVYHFQDTHWSIITGMLNENVLAQSNQTFKTILLLIMALTLLATILGYLILQKFFVSPIEAINKQLNNPLQENGKDYKLLSCEDKGEIGTLVNNLNNRTVSLAETQGREAEEITKRMQNEKMLLQQSKMAAMGEMMDVIAHQWKQPLNALSMYSEIIKSDFEEGNIDKNYIENFRDGTQVQIDHMVNTLDEFRTYFRPNKEHEKFKLLDVLNSALFLTKDDLLKHRITVQIVQKDSIIINGTANEFKHLVLNIINNAKDAFSENNIERGNIFIRLISDEKSKRMEIEDNAGGIPEKIIPDIFKSNVTTKEEDKGTGIGLYMSMQIATKHHASLTVENKNNGACFTVTFHE